MLGLSWPPLPFPFQLLQFGAWILLFRLAQLSATWRESAYWSYASFVIWNLITTYWLMMATPMGGIAAILANSAVMVIPFVLMRTIQKRGWPALLTTMIQAAIWISYEFLHHRWDLAWPWLVLGNAWAQQPAMVQYISYTGYLGISGWVLWTSALAYQAVQGGRKAAGWAALTVGLAFPLLSFGLYLYRAPLSNNTGSTPKAEVVVVQPNFDSYQNLFGYSNPMQPLNLLLSESDSLLTPETDAVIWPENAIEPYISNQTTSNFYAERVRQTLMDSVDAWQFPIIAGTTYLKYFDPPKAPPLYRGPAQKPYVYYNAALGFYPPDSTRVYNKHNLVPIVERIPFLNALNEYNIFGINWADYPWYGRGNEHTQFPVAGTQTPALICYDSVFPNWILQYVRDGAGFLTIITNDGWWGYSSGHLQHYAYARLRAIEFGRWIVRSANNGISGIIDPRGLEYNRTPFWKRAAFKYEVPIRTEQTFYTEYGDWFGGLNLTAALLIIVGLLFTGIRRRLHTHH